MRKNQLVKRYIIYHMFIVTNTFQGYYLRLKLGSHVNFTVLVFFCQIFLPLCVFFLSFSFEQSKMLECSTHSLRPAPYIVKIMGDRIPPCCTPDSRFSGFEISFPIRILLFLNCFKKMLDIGSGIFKVIFFSLI